VVFVPDVFQIKYFIRLCWDAHKSSFQEARHSDLWSKYKFICSCRRCIASPEPYTDLILNVRMKSERKHYHYLLASFSMFH
jgi:hypothetical protein